MKKILHGYVYIFVALILINQCTGNKKYNVIRKEVRAYKKIMKLRQESEPDIEQITFIYRNELSSLVSRAGSHLPDIKREIDTYLNNANFSEKVIPALQGVEKSLQLIFVKKIINGLEKVGAQIGGGDKSLKNINDVQEYYAAIENTAKRRGRYIGTENIFHKNIIGGLKIIKKAVLEQNIREYILGQERVVNSIQSIYFLSVLYELEGIAKYRGSKSIKAEEKRIEAMIFFKILMGTAVDDSSILIEKELTKKCDNINIHLIIQNLKNAFPILVSKFSGKMHFLE